MELIITAGGTRERIDSVRAITNDATGKLGSLIAEEFSQRLKTREHKIYYLCGMGAIVPEVKDADILVIRIEGTDQLSEKMRYLLTTQKIDAVIHSMAVSDYKVSSVTTAELVAQTIYQKIRISEKKPSLQELREVVTDAFTDQAIKEPKISSGLEHPLMMLKRTPKIIDLIKETSPQTVLVGFKLLSGVNREMLIETAYQLLKRSRCDFVLANDTDTIKAGKHTGYLVDKNGSYETFTGKEQIAKGIADRILSAADKA